MCVCVCVCLNVCHPLLCICYNFDYPIAPYKLIRLVRNKPDIIIFIIVHEHIYLNVSLYRLFCMFIQCVIIGGYVCNCRDMHYESGGIETYLDIIKFLILSMRRCTPKILIIQITLGIIFHQVNMILFFCWKNSYESNMWGILKFVSVDSCCYISDMVG